MKYEYKVIKAKNALKAEEIMNEMAKLNWRVISNTYWMNFAVQLIITFEREAKE